MASTARETVRPVQKNYSRAKSKPYIAFMLLTAAIVVVQLARGRQTGSKQQVSAKTVSTVIALGILLVVIAAAGEVSPGIATGFSGLLLVAVLLGGTNATQYIFSLPGKLKGA